MYRSKRAKKPSAHDETLPPPVQTIQRHFRDFDLLEPKGKVAMSRKTAMWIYELNFMIDVDGVYKLGGLDDIEVFDKEIGGDDVKDEDAMDVVDDDSDSRRKKHMFLGELVIDKESELSPRGVTLIKEAGGDLSILRRGGKIYVRVVCQYHKYQYPGTKLDRISCVTSTNGDPDDPIYHVFQIGSYSLFALQHSLRIQERKWWLEFIREQCEEHPERQKSQRSIEWFVERYVELFPVHGSGVNPPSHGPRKHIHPSEAYRALGRHASYLQKALNSMRPRIVNPDLLIAIRREYSHLKYSLEREKEPDIDVVESDEEEACPSPQIEPLPEDDEETGLKMMELQLNQTGAVNRRGSHRYTVKRSPKLLGKTIEHVPSLSAAFTYTCPFDMLNTDYHSTDVITSCPFHLNLLKPSREFFRELPPLDQKLVKDKRFNRDDPIISEAFLAVLAKHFRLHKNDRTRITYGNGDYIMGWYQVKLGEDYISWKSV